MIRWQRRRRHFKSGQATANKRSLMHVHGVGGGGGGLTTGAGGESPQARVRSRTTASSGMHHIASSCMSYTHVYLATRGCQCMQSGNETKNLLESGLAKA